MNILVLKKGSIVGGWVEKVRYKNGSGKFCFHCLTSIPRSISEVKVKVAQSCPTPCDPMDYTVHGILQARLLEWVAGPFTRDLPKKH